MANVVTGRKERVLVALYEGVRRNGYPPSIRDLMHVCDISSTSVVVYQLDGLERAGFITRDREVARSIRLTNYGLTAASRMARDEAGEPCPACGRS